MENDLQEPLTSKKPSSFSPKLLFRNKTLLVGIGVALTIAMGSYIFLAPAHNQVANLPTLDDITTAPLPTETPTPTLVPTDIPPTAIPTPTITVGTSWKTYTNTQYGYTISYPPDWIAQDLGILEPKIPNYVTFDDASALNGARFITVGVTTRSYDEQLALGAGSSPITVAGIQSTEQGFEDSDGNTSTVVVIPRADNLLVLRAKTAYLPIFNLMLSTLKLTE